MPKCNSEKIKYDSAIGDVIHVSIGKIKENTQITAEDTGWSEEEKERMRQAGYDGVDMVRAWYN